MEDGRRLEMVEEEAVILIPRESSTLNRSFHDGFLIRDVEKS